MNNNLKSIAIWLAIGVFMMTIFNQFSGSTRFENKLVYSQFMDQVKSGSIAKVEIDGETSFLQKNESVYIPLGSKHRLSNPFTVPLVLIEVQSGSYLGEDDIIRFEDIYGRSSK